VIATFPKVQEVVVVGVPGYLGEHVVKAVVVAREACQEQEIVDFCRDRLTDFKIPRLVEFVEKIPRNAFGKILRKDLVS
jgi:long-chain acyl-CoA synthetase